MKKALPLFTAAFAAFWLWCVFFLRPAADNFGYDRMFSLIGVSLFHLPLGAALLLFASRGHGSFPFSISVLGAPLVHIIASQLSHPIDTILLTLPACVTILLAFREVIIPTPTKA